MKRLTALLLSLATPVLLLGCTDLGAMFKLPVPATKTNTPLAATPAPVASVAPALEPQKTNLTLTQKDGEAANPIGPEDLTSIMIDGVTVPASDITFEKSPFTVQADTGSDYQVAYQGAGKYTVVNKTTGKVLQNRSLIIFNLLNAKDPLVVPVIQGILENKIKMTIDLSTGKIYGGVQKDDGTLDDTKAVFTIGTDGKMTVTEPTGKQSVFTRNDASSTNLPEPDTVVDLTADEVRQQVASVSTEVPATSAIADYVGLWLYQGLGQKIIVQMKDLASSSFEASVTVNGTLYAGQGSYDPLGKNETLTLKVPTDEMNVNIAKVGNNALTYTLVSTSNQNYKVFQNVPVNLQRVRVAN